MENENKRKDLNDKGLWSPKSIMIIGSLVSFFIAGIMSAINYGRLGYTDKKKKLILTMTILFILTIVISEKVSSMIPWASINIGISAALKNEQEKLYKEHIKNGGKKASLKIPLILSTIVLLLTFGIMYIDYYNKTIVYYDENIGSGFAKLYHKNGKLRYEGNFKDGFAHKKGKSYYENGNVLYEGDFKDGLFHGKGKFYDEKGNLSYEGDFKDDLAYGEGKFYDEEGKLRYEGNVKEGFFHGKGKLHYENGNVLWECTI